MFHHHHDHDCCCECVQETNRLLRWQIHQNNVLISQGERVIRLLHILVLEEEPPYLAKFQLFIKEGTNMPTPGPVTLTAVNQQVTAVLANPLDQFGQPFTGVIPPLTFSDDNPAAATTDPTSGVVTAVANGNDNVTGTLTNSLGQPVSAVLQVIVDIPAPPEPVLTSFELQVA